jgi:hypothetical protein
VILVGLECQDDLVQLVDRSGGGENVCCLTSKARYDLAIKRSSLILLSSCVEEFIEERAKLIRSLADRADPFIKVRLIKLAERYEHELWMRSQAKRAHKPSAGGISEVLWKRPL